MNDDVRSEVIDFLGLMFPNTLKTIIENLETSLDESDFSGTQARNFQKAAQEMLLGLTGETVASKYK